MQRAVILGDELSVLVSFFFVMHSTSGLCSEDDADFWTVARKELIKPIWKHSPNPSEQGFFDLAYAKL